MSLSQYLSVGELTVGWLTLEECTPTTKSSETQFCKPFSASEIIPKQTKFVTEGYGFLLVVVLADHGGQTEFVWPGYGRSTDTPQMDFSNEGYRESGFQRNLLAPTSHFATLEMAYYFRTVRM